MNSKNRFLITIVIIAIIAIALLTSFGRYLFTNNIPSVSLPDLGSTSDASHPNTDWHSTNTPSLPITVTTDTVQEIVRSLNRADSYYSKQQVTLFWDETSTTTDISVWKHEGWTSIEQTLSNGNTRRDLVGSDIHHYWYDGSLDVLTISVDDTSADLSQHIPTYEDIADIPVETITETEYTTFGDAIPSIFVKVQEDDRTVAQYWISTTTGLLVCAIIEHDGVPIYQLVADAPIQTPCPTLTPFLLPDGTSVI